MNKKLMPLDEFDKKRRDSWGRINDNSPRPNGIACPECGHELYDTAPNFQLTSNPPQVYIGCKNCDYTGTRVS